MAGSPATLVPQPEPLAVFPTVLSCSWPVTKVPDAASGASGPVGPVGGFGGRGALLVCALAARAVMPSAPPTRLSAAPASAPLRSNDSEWFNGGLPSQGTSLVSRCRSGFLDA